MLDVIPTKKERLAGDVHIRRSLGCSGNDTVELRRMRGGSRAKIRITALHFRKAGFGLFRNLLGRIAWYPMALERRTVQGLSSSITFSKH